MSSGPKIFKNKCDYRMISGDVCGKKCIETRCSGHKGCESYTIQCIYRDENNIQCGRYTKSKINKCSHHARCPTPVIRQPEKPVEKVEEVQKVEKVEEVQKVDEVTVDPVKRNMQLARDAKQRKANERLQEITKKVKNVQIAESESEGE